MTSSSFSDLLLFFIFSHTYFSTSFSFLTYCYIMSVRPIMLLIIYFNCIVTGQTPMEYVYILLEMVRASAVFVVVDSCLRGMISRDTLHCSILSTLSVLWGRSWLLYSVPLLFGYWSTFVTNIFGVRDLLYHGAYVFFDFLFLLKKHEPHQLSNEC